VARSTLPILAVGGVTLLNQSVLHEKDIDWRVPIGTAFAAAAFALVEKASPTLAVGGAWIALLAVLLTRIDPNTPSPTETLLKFWNG
jgi:hypothetical protein